MLGRLVASGLLARNEALDALLHPPAEPYRVAREGLQCRLTHALDDATRAHELRRDATASAVRRAVAVPLMTLAPRDALLRAADAADPDHDLLPRERRALIEAEVAQFVLRSRRVPGRADARVAGPA